MLVDDILETIDQDWGNEEDDSDDKEYIDDDEEVEEDDIDEDSLMDEEDIEENVDEDLFMKDDISDAAGLVFAPGDLAEEISFLRSLSGYPDGMLLLMCSTRARRIYEKNNESIRLEMWIKFERYEVC